MRKPYAITMTTGVIHRLRGGCRGVFPRTRALDADEAHALLVAGKARVCRGCHRADPLSIAPPCASCQEPLARPEDHADDCSVTA